MSLAPDPRERLREIGALPDDQLDVAEACLLLGGTLRPGLDPRPYLRHLDRMATEVAEMAHRRAGEAGLERRVEALRQVLGRRYGYLGDDACVEDPEVPDLAQTMDRRKGPPLAVSLLYLAVAKRLDWAMRVIEFPVRFMVRLDQGGRRAILDPSDGGHERPIHALRDMLKAALGNQAEFAPSHWRELEGLDLLERYQNRLRSDLLRAGRLEDALRATRAMREVTPEAPGLWREEGLLLARLGRDEGAIVALEGYLDRAGQELARREAAIMLQDLRRKRMEAR